MCILCKLSLKYEELKELVAGEQLYMFDRNVMDYLDGHTLFTDLQEYDPICYSFIKFRRNVFHLCRVLTGTKEKYGLQVQLEPSTWRPLPKNACIAGKTPVGWRGPLIRESVFRKNFLAINDFVNNRLKNSVGFVEARRRQRRYSSKY